MSGWKDGFADEYPWCPNKKTPCSPSAKLRCAVCKVVEEHMGYMDTTILAEKVRHDATFDKLTDANEAKGNLLDFISSVRVWAANQPTGVSLVESCSKILEKYTVKR